MPLCDILSSIHDHDTYQLATCKMTDQLFGLMDKFVTREVRVICSIQREGDNEDDEEEETKNISHSFS